MMQTVRDVTRFIAALLQPGSMMQLMHMELHSARMDSSLFWLRCQQLAAEGGTVADTRTHAHWQPTLWMPIVAFAQASSCHIVN
jgi:hypothetical protein